MLFIELTHTTTGYNVGGKVGGKKIYTAVVGKRGAWSITEAVKLIITGQAKFFRNDGEQVTSLAVLPEKSGDMSL